MLLMMFVVSQVYILRGNFMVDHVIVTVVYKTCRFDMELPANTPIEKIKPNLISALQWKGVSLNKSLDLTCGGRVLKPADTLLQSGVWDGCYLELQDRG